MATAHIIFQQNNDGYNISCSRDDLVLNLPVTVLNQDNTNVISWEWSIVDKPNNSNSALVAPTASTTTFTPDVVGTYLIQLIINSSIIKDKKGAAVKTAQLHYRIPAATETIEFDINKGWAAATYTALKVLDDAASLLIATDGSTVATTSPTAIAPAQTAQYDFGTNNLHWRGIYSTFYSGLQQSLSFTSTPAFNPTNGNSINMILTADLGIWGSVIAGYPGMQFSLTLTQDGTGGRLIGTPPANLIWTTPGIPNDHTIPVLSTGINKSDTFFFEWCPALNAYIERSRSTNN